MIFHEKAYFALRDPKEIYVQGESFREDERIQNGFNKVILDAAARNKKKLKKGSVRYNKLFAAVVRAYLRVLTKVIVETVVGGDRIFIGKKLLSFHIFNMPPYFSAYKIRYKYHRKLRGDFPILRVGIHKHRLKMISIGRQTHENAFLINSGIRREMSSMITHKIIKEKITYSDNPYNVFVKDKTLTNGRSIYNT